MVVDASVVAAIIFGEPEAPRARQMLTGAELQAPGLLHYELANIARNKAVAAPGQQALVAQQLRDGLAFDVRLDGVHLPAVLGLALETGLTAYDASYLLLAQRLDTPLATFDRQLRNAAEGRVPLA